MSSKVKVSNIINELLVSLKSLPDSDFEKLESGEFSIQLKLVKNRRSKRIEEYSSDKDMDSLLESLKECRDRDKGYDTLNARSLTRKELEGFAKSVDIHIMKQDSIEKIKDKIVEGIVGASIRSIVIQGSKT